MGKLTLNEINNETDIRREWERFGFDSTEYLPYWVAHMSYIERVAYLKLTKHEYVDFKEEMMNKDFDWSKWISMQYRL